MNSADYPPNKGQTDDAPEEAADMQNEADAEPDTQDRAKDADDIEDPVAKEMADLNERILRLAAELENTRRRAAREKADAGRYAITNFAQDLVGVADNFERALRAAGDDEAPASAEALSGIVAGLKMTEKELLSVLERHGIRKIFPEGEKFDPNLHQAVAQIPGGSIPTGHVVDVAQPGFMIGDRVLRAAMVTVSSGAAQDDEPGAHVDTRA